MPSALSLGTRIRSNIPAELAYNAQLSASRDISQSQLRLSTGARINQATDDVSGYITSRSLMARNSSLRTALISTGEATNVTAIAQDAYDNIHSLLSNIRDSAITASSGVLGTDEVVALAKGAFRLAQQIQAAVDSTVFGGQQLIGGSYSGDWIVGYNANNQALTVSLDLTANNSDMNIRRPFYLDSINNQRNIEGVQTTTDFAAVENLDLNLLNNVSADDLGIFNSSDIKSTIVSLSMALGNIANAAAYTGGVQVRLESQNQSLSSQVVNYQAAISRINDADVADEQLKLTKSAFLQQSSLFSMAQANQSPFLILNLLN